MDIANLQAQIDALRASVSALAQEVAALRATSHSGSRSASASPDGLSRRRLLVGASAAIGGAHLLHPSGAQAQSCPAGAGANDPSTCASDDVLDGFTGCRNTAFGGFAGSGLLPDDAFPDSGGGYFNTAIGFDAMIAATGGRAEQNGQPVSFTHPYCFRNTAVGRGALRDTADSYENVAVGSDAGRHTIIGSKNTFVGSNAGKWVGSFDPACDGLNAPVGGASKEWAPTGGQDKPPHEGSRNTLIGRNAGHHGVKIQACVAVGYNAGNGWAASSDCIAIGRNSFFRNPFATRTIAIGSFAMYDSPEGGSDTVAIGHEALMHSVGINNVVIGTGAGRVMAAGNQNVFIGDQAAGEKPAGTDNVIIGRAAGERSDGGNGNIFIGRMAGHDAQGSDTLIIHNATTTPFLLGKMGEAGAWWLQLRGHFLPSASNAWTLGNPAARWQQVYATNGTINTSDATLKKDVAEDDLGLDFIRELCPVVWKWRDQSDEGDHRGLIAQDVAKVLSKFEGRRGFAGLIAGEKLGLCMTEFIGPLIKSVQELDARMREIERH
jgi:hypothetical protein